MTDSATATTAALVQSVHSQVYAPRNILLATAWVNLHTSEGRTIRVRALLDQGSTFSFISESLCQALRTRRQRTHLPIRCFGDKFTGAAHSRVPITLSACTTPGPTFPLMAYVFQKITAYAASQIKPVDFWPHLRGLVLADPDPSSRHTIHLLIGADLYGSLLRNDIRQGPLGTPTAQLTVFGWVLSGPAGTLPSPSPSSSAQVNTCAATEDLQSLLQQFWSDENVPSTTPSLTDEEQLCEQHFSSSHTRTSQGRYVVRLPFKTAPPPSIGTSYLIALKLYNKLEQRLSRNAELSQAYHAFLQEYQTLGHMERVPETVPSPQLAAYIPHHAVTREESTTSKLQVVFNASCRTSNGTTLNEHLLAGPKLQQDLPAIMLRWRQFRFVYTADVAKMYRQILVHPGDVDYQRILWSPPGACGVQHFRLLTVTYGTTCAPYLALRVLQQLATDDGHLFPKAVPIVRESIYVDDALFGADDKKQFLELREQLVALLQRGQFTLRKWTANSCDLLSDIPPDARAISDLTFSTDNSLKVLGLSWVPLEDAFKFNVTCPSAAVSTKRSVLSCIAKLFDPLGWAAPVVIAAKVLMQELWLANVRWDEPLPDALRNRWINYYSDLPNLKRVRIPRWTRVHHTNLNLELHGFADASSRAYAAVVYLRVANPDGASHLSLLASKTKVAPLNTVSIPRLELNAVVLLSRLLSWVQDSLHLTHVPVHGWTDSSVTLAWVTQHPSKWRTYVANRVSAVQTRCLSARWGHVPSADNPADCASRGLSASELVHFDLWWRGPAWLARSSEFWPQPHELSRTTLNAALTEIRGTASHHVSSNPEWDLPERFSSWTTLTRVTAYVRRFARRARGGVAPDPRATLSVSELRDAETFWLGFAQRACLAAEWKALHEQRPLSRSSCLRKLNPFVGNDKLIRLGGRLENAPLSYDERHPIILPDHRVARLLIDRAHKATLHGGIQLTLRLLRQRFWILSARSLVKGHIHQCITCTRHRAQISEQQMGNLPASRVTPSAPFTSTGVDYAGPFNLLASVARGQRITKHYVAVFICLATKVILLECR
ncbi:PREDICTED: uncharacterized protein LOC105450317 [Wasmannia auropunctata]|uniref:uncharacterized protein LOC105450317 n=1 Tax=Wasmannia auropunctata TaxID=64793 RepID=UPI0005EEDDD7|nr:PREDICTED: uncharacterized protein LOC105450317 [Wasmannia auropunctata]